MIPDWLRPIEDGARTITAEQLTRFTVPPGEDARPCAVLVLFADGPHGPEVVLTERAHDMRSHPGQVSFAGGALEPGETVEEAALREAWEEIGLEADGVETFGRLPELWMPPSNAAVTPVLAYWHTPGPLTVNSPAEVHAIHREPVAHLLDPASRYTVRHPSGFRGPAFRIGPDRDVVLWGFTGGILSRTFDHVGWTRPWDESVVEDLPEHMLEDGPRSRRLSPRQVQALRDSASQGPEQDPRPAEPAQADAGAADLDGVADDRPEGGEPGPSAASGTIGASPAEEAR